ncbi:C4-dicarboxylate ABC transporter substrate-binding protein [Bradyrhizobium sediminis]|uniref:C4-dicarboxylate ABC transporter substrate-binding protein n=1 Tax=Bradyrhizobium sediminis TaxID=2840469 RepID=A0A975RMK2_9BRAD|nr:TAXI family TRAP transporter solute-binding subunit [Bradyrhizobium sediminis]QWG12793.1 C4-dicarboxylate ABC transporter substrate-binding protein [Bradyrhizobium sediminis]
MSAEVPTPPAARPSSRSRVVKSNRRQVLLFAALTVILTVATVWGSRIWLNSETLTFAVGDANGPEARFAAKLAAMLKSTNSRLHLRIVHNPDNAKALAQFDRKQADLAVLRTDARVPPRARAIAILEHDVLLLFSPGKRKIKSLAELKKKKIAVVADADSGAAFIRRLLEVSDDPDAASRLQLAPPNASYDKLLAPGGYGAVIAIAPASRMMRDKSFAQYARRGGFTLNAISGSKALVRRNSGLTEETLAAGVLSSSPPVPEEDLETVGLQWLLVAQSRLSTATTGNLARAIYENKAELALENGFASRIEPASTDKDAFVVAHQGAADYINDDTKSFVDRYSDLAYLGAGVLSVIGSLFIALYTKVTRIAPEKASELATAILDIGERMEHATSMEALDALQDELEAILRGVVIGLRDGTISSDGLETFKLGYQFVRDELGMRRESLRRHAGHDDNVVIVKTAQSA